MKISFLWFHANKYETSGLSIVKFSDDIGGAIERDIRVRDITVVDPRLHVDNVLRTVAMLGATAPMVTEFVHGLTDFIPRNIEGGDQNEWRYIARNEEELHKHLIENTTGKGLKHDGSHIGRTIFESFDSYPELQNLYSGI